MEQQQWDVVRLEAQALQANKDVRGDWLLGYMAIHRIDGGVPEQGIEWLKRAAAKGNAEAKFDLGFAYREKRGVPMDRAKGHKLMLEAARQGVVRARYGVGQNVFAGWGVQSNFEAAVPWLEGAAQQGHVPAMIDLSVMYFNGDGVPKDYVMAAALDRVGCIPHVDMDGRAVDVSRGCVAGRWLSDLPRGILSPQDQRDAAQLTSVMSREGYEAGRRMRAIQRGQLDVAAGGATTGGRVSTAQRCRTEIRTERRPFMENVCDYGPQGPTNCRNIATRWEEFQQEVHVCP